MRNINKTKINKAKRYIFKETGKRFLLHLSVLTIFQTVLFK